MKYGFVWLIKVVLTDDITIVQNIGLHIPVDMLCKDRGYIYIIATLIVTLQAYRV